MKNKVILLLLILLIIVNIQLYTYAEPLRDYGHANVSGKEYNAPIAYKKIKNEILNPKEGCIDKGSGIYDCSGHIIYGGGDNGDYDNTEFKNNPYYSHGKVKKDLKYFNNSSNILLDHLQNNIDNSYNTNVDVSYTDIHVDNIVTSIECEEGDYLNNLIFTYKDGTKSSNHLPKSPKSSESNKIISFDNYGYIKSVIIQYDIDNNKVVNIYFQKDNLKTYYFKGSKVPQKYITKNITCPKAHMLVDLVFNDSEILTKIKMKEINSNILRNYDIDGIDYDKMYEKIYDNSIGIDYSKNKFSEEILKNRLSENLSEGLVALDIKYFNNVTSMLTGSKY